MEKFPKKTSAEKDAPADPSRRGFLKGLGGLAVAAGAGAVGSRIERLLNSEESKNPKNSEELQTKINKHLEDIKNLSPQNAESLLAHIGVLDEERERYERKWSGIIKAAEGMIDRKGTWTYQQEQSILLSISRLGVALDNVHELHLEAAKWIASSSTTKGASNFIAEYEQSLAAVEQLANDVEQHPIAETFLQALKDAAMGIGRT